MADSDARKFDSITNGLDELDGYLQSLDKTDNQAHYVLYQLGSQKILLKIDLEQKAVIYDDLFGRKINVVMEDCITKNLPGIRIVDARKNERNIYDFSASQSIDLHDLNWEEHTADKLDKVNLVESDIAKEFANRKTPLGLFDKEPSVIQPGLPENMHNINLKK
ncbi:MAG: hypothetical protein P4M12_12980 [Gammaproteobacteria bacterium]|nr:hypothetical protein [Gammaproteobacteria bacterium]